MPNPKHPDWISFYKLTDIDKRAWIAPKTYQILKDKQQQKEEVAEVVEFVTDRIWFNLFLIGVGVGIITIILLIWKATW